MNSDFNLNSYRNCTSEFFHLVPPKLVTFGGGSINKINSGISDNSSNKQDIIQGDEEKIQNDIIKVKNLNQIQSKIYQVIKK